MTVLELQPLPVISHRNLVMENSPSNSAMCELSVMFILNLKLKIFTIYFVFHNYMGELKWNEQ